MSHIQSVEGTSASGNTIASSAGSAITAGHGICGMVGCVTTAAGASFVIKDNASTPNTYTQPDAVVDAAGNTVAFVQFYLTNIPNGGGTTLTATVTGGGTIGFGEILWDEFSTEMDSTKTLDGHALTEVSTVTGTNSYKSATVTNGGGELIFACAGETAGTATLTDGTSPAFTGGTTDNADSFYSEYILSGSATQGVWTASDAVSGFVLGVMTFKTAAVSFIPPRRHIVPYSIPILLRR